MSFKNIDRPGVSIVLCCYNSGNRIVPTLQHLAKQQGIFFPWEILVIDNNSSDNTSNLALHTWQANGSPCDLRIVKELKVGTMHARLRGIVESSYQYLLFCDDDNWFHPTYVKVACQQISKSKDIAAVGGKGLIEFEPEFKAPIWLNDFMNGYGTGPQGKEDGDTTYFKGCLYTAGAILDRAWLNQLYVSGFESSLKGRDGKSLVAGEDTELTYALKLIGGKLYYSSEMYFQHFMPKNRISWTYLKKLWRSFGYSDFLLSPYKNHFRGKRHPGFILIVLKQTILLSRSFILALGFFFRIGNRHVLRCFYLLGQLHATFFSYQTYLQNKEMVKKLGAR